MGLIVNLSGVDGSGKTTTAKLVAERLKKSGVKVTYHHELDFFLLKLMFSISAIVFGNTTSNDLRDKAITSIDEGAFRWRYLYYLFLLFDSLTTYIYFKFKKGIVIYDRWIYDLTTIFDHKHCNAPLLYKLYLGFPRPDIMILLTVTPEMAYQRKRDDISHVMHGLRYYEIMQNRMLKLARRFKCDGIIDSNRSKDEVADEVLAIIRKVCLSLVIKNETALSSL